MNFVKRVRQLLEIRKGRMGGAGLGPGGKCVCTECDYEEKHVAGEPCYKKKCPKCGARMIRK